MMPYTAWYDKIQYAPGGSLPWPGCEEPGRRDAQRRAPGGQQQGIPPRH